VRAGPGPAPAIDPADVAAALEADDLPEPARRALAALLDDELCYAGHAHTAAAGIVARPACPHATRMGRFAARSLREGAESADVGRWLTAHFVTWRVQPRVALALDDRAPRGAEGAPVALVEFSDFECPFCQRSSELLARVVAAHGAEIRLFFKHFPLDSHPMARPAALAAEAAQRQGRFWEFHDVLFANQRGLSDTLLRVTAEELGLDVARFDADRASDDVARRVDGDKAEGRDVGVAATPSLFVNGRAFPDVPKTLENIADRIAMELELAPTPRSTRGE
jgi:predicted DsbA family dithiol-disulfide isomerase